MRGTNFRFLCGIEQVLDRHVALGPIAIVIYPRLAVVGERHTEVADTHVEQRRLAAVRLAAGAGAANDNALLALGHPQRFACKPRINPLAVGKQHGDAPDDAGFVTRTEIDAANTGRGLVQHRQIGDRAGERRQHIGWLDADEREPCLRRRPRVVWRRAFRKAEHHVGLAHRIGEHPVVIGQLLEQRHGQFAIRQIGFLQIAEKLLRRGPVRLRENDRESGYSRAQFRKAIGDRSQPRSRPGPLSVGCDRGLIDDDDAYREIRVSARLQTLIGIECPLLQFGDDPRTFGAQPRQRREHDQCCPGRTSVLAAAETAQAGQEGKASPPQEQFEPLGRCHFVDSRHSFISAQCPERKRVSPMRKRVSRTLPLVSGTLR